MGIRRPGFQLLSLISTVPSPDHITQIPITPPLHAPCLMPDQLGIYLYSYIPLVILSLLVLLVMRVRRGRKHDHQGTSETLRDVSRCNSTHTVDADSFLPLPANRSREHHSPRGRSYSSRWTWSFTFGGRRRRVMLANPFGDWRTRDHRMPQHHVGVITGWLQDVAAVAWPPILVFLATSWWVTQW